MSNSEWPANTFGSLVPGMPKLAELSDQELLAELAQGLTLTAQTLHRLGLIWVELEKRGKAPSKLREGLGWTLPLIGAGLLAAEAVVAFADRASILHALEGVSLDLQRQLAQGELVEVSLTVSNDRTELVPITAIPHARLRVVFADGKLMSPAEQRVRLGKRRQQPKDETGRAMRYRPRYDADKGVIQVGKMNLRLDDLLQELASVSGPDIPPVEENEYVALKTRLKHDEMTRFLAVCQKAGLPEWEMIRKALRAFGLI